MASEISKVIKRRTTVSQLNEPEAKSIKLKLLIISYYTVETNAKNLHSHIGILNCKVFFQVA